MFLDFGFGIGAAIIVVLLVVSSLKILREYQRAVVFLLGRFQEVKGPGPESSRWCASTCARSSLMCRRRM